MFRKSIFLFVLIALQVLLAGNAFAAENGFTWWSGGSGDHLFNNGGNWWQGIAPDINNTTPNEPNASFSEPIPSYCMVNSATGKITVRDLFVGDWTTAADVEPNKATLDVIAQTLNVTGILVMGGKDTTFQSAGIKAIGDVNVYNGGIVNVGGDVWVGAEGSGYLNVHSGDVNIGGTLRCPGGPMPYQINYGASYDRYEFGEGRINLYGGTIEANDIYAYNVSGNEVTHINLLGGTLTLNGDKTSAVGNLISQGKIYGYNGDGDILSDYNVRNPGKTTVTGTYDPNRALFPSPANYAQEVSEDSNLTWAEANSAATNHVYFGTSFVDVNNGNVSADKGTQTAALYNPGGMKSDTTYYWRIDEVNSPMTTRGNVWSFTTGNKGRASHPIPADNTTNVYPEQKLSWTRGAYASNHQVYLGTNFNDVNNANTSTSGIYRGVDANTTYTPPSPDGLLLGPTTYYWRIDEVNDANGDTWKGHVWMLKTSTDKVLNTFDIYQPTGGATHPQLADEWKVSGSNVSISLAPTLDGTTPATSCMDYNAMKIVYNNSISPWYSEVNYVIPSSSALNKRDWVTGGAKMLTLYFHGVQTNTAEKLYITIKDSNGVRATVAFPDSNVLVQRVDMVGNGTSDRPKYDENWQWWLIDLKKFSDANVNLKDVRYLTIGIGAGDGNHPGNASGKLYVDDIALYPRWCPISFNISFDQSADADLNNDCSVDMSDLQIFLNSWLESSYQVTAANSVDPSGLVLWYKFDEKTGYDVYDSSGHGNTGSLIWSLWDSVGHDGNGAVIFQGYNGTYPGQYVSVPIAAAADTNLGGHSTVAFWVKDQPLPTAQPTGTQVFQIGPSGQGNLQLYSQWTGYFSYVCGRRDNGWQDTLAWGRYGFTNPQHPLNQWVHYAFTKDHDTGIMRIYQNGRAVIEYADAEANSMPALVTGTSFFTIGAYRYPDGEGGYYTGEMDDFRLYKRALSDAEILRLYVGGTDPCSITQSVLSPADVVKDNIVNFKDFAVIAAKWMVNPLLWP